MATQAGGRRSWAHTMGHSRMRAPCFLGEPWGGSSSGGIPGASPAAQPLVHMSYILNEPKLI